MLLTLGPSNLRVLQGRSLFGVDALGRRIRIGLVDGGSGFMSQKPYSVRNRRIPDYIVSLEFECPDGVVSVPMSEFADRDRTTLSC